MQVLEKTKRQDLALQVLEKTKRQDLALQVLAKTTIQCKKCSVQKSEYAATKILIGS